MQPRSGQAKTDREGAYNGPVPLQGGIASGPAATYNSLMNQRDRWVAIGLAAGVALATLLPTWIAHQMAPPGHTFAGFLLNPVDGFSYLAKMRQGFDGGWQFRLPYAAEPGAGAFLFTYYLVLGHIARFLGADLLLVLHAARVAAAALMFAAIYRFLEEFVAERGERWFAYALCLVGAGWGWMGIAFGFVASDLSIPESTPFLSAYANAHFPMAVAAFMGAAVGVLGGHAGKPRWVMIALACGAGMALVLPFVLLPAVAAMLAGIVVLALQERRSGAPSSVRRRLVALGAFLLGAAPWAAYDLWLLRTRPDLAAWNAQNQTPSPSPGAYLLGFAPLLLLAAVAVVADRRLKRNSADPSRLGDRSGDPFVCAAGPPTPTLAGSIRPACRPGSDRDVDRGAARRLAPAPGDACAGLRHPDQPDRHRRRTGWGPSGRAAPGSVEATRHVRCTGWPRTPRRGPLCWPGRPWATGSLPLQTLASSTVTPSRHPTPLPSMRWSSRSLPRRPTSMQRWRYSRRAQLTLCTLVLRSRRSGLRHGRVSCHRQWCAVV